MRVPPLPYLTGTGVIETRVQRDERRNSSELLFRFKAIYANAWVPAIEVIENVFQYDRASLNAMQFSPASRKRSL